MDIPWPDTINRSRVILLERILLRYPYNRTYIGNKREMTFLISNNKQTDPIYSTPIYDDNDA